MSDGRDIAVLVVPFDAGHRGWRMGAGPDAVLEAGLFDALASAGHRPRRIDVEPVVDDFRSELRTGFGLQRAIRETVVDAVRGGEFPVLLAGDCNASLGVVAALQATGSDLAFLWCDAHADIHTPETDAFGSLDSHGLAMLTGRAWHGLVTRTGLRPLADERVALVGARAIDDAETRTLVGSSIHRLTVADARDARRRRGVLRALAAGPDPALHLHVDADVIDPSVAPANAYAAPDGLHLHDLTELVTDAATHLRLSSLSVASYDPTRDADRELATGLVRLVVDATSCAAAAEA